MSMLKTVFIYVFLLFTFFCFAQEKEESQENHELPAELFYQQRSYPDETFDLKAYLNALDKAQAQDEARNGATQGFNATWTLHGPTNIRGRVNTIALHPTNPDIAMIGFATGGLWKTTDGGKNWIPIFEKQLTPSIGCVAYAPSDPNIVYVGTGDPNVTGYPFIGTGVYKSTDGGNTWKSVGLSETRITSKIIVHPTNPDIVYVGAMGLPFERDEFRGLYKTINGGSSWSKIYYFSNQAGVIDMVMNPTNPNQLFVAGWDRIRNNKETITEGLNCRIVKTNDGGGNWVTQFVGFPTSGIGRIGLAISTVNTSTVYASVSDDSQNLKGVYKTINAGTTWNNVITNPNFAQQVNGGMGWYFGQIRVVPGEIYLLGVDLWRSKDDGFSWENISEGTDAHVDMHDLVIRGNTLYLGSDGGVYTSKDAGLSWQSFEQIPSTAFYKVTKNNKNGLYYAGAQDHGILLGDKNRINDWRLVQRGDGFRTCFTDDNTARIFTETQWGNIWVSKDSATTFQLATFGIQSSDRVAWDAPYFVSKLQKNNMYYGTHRVYKNQNLDNPLWSPISLDLTQGNVFGAQFHVITCLDESKQDSNKIYAGTSDGKLWTNSPSNPSVWEEINNGLPNRYVTSVHTSPSGNETVFVTHSGYKDNVFTPHIHKSTNGGLNWTPINGNLPLFAVNDLFILPNNADSILFAATDAGVYASTDRGVFWQRLGSNMPYVPIYDIEYDQPNNLLVAATHGRALMTYPIDSVTYKAPPLLSVSGKIVTFTDQKPVRNVKVKAAFGTKAIEAITDSLGIFRFNAKITQGAKVVITPIKNEKGSNGITTADLVEIQKNILSTKKILKSTSLIAADVTNNGLVSTSDMVAIRKVILALQDSFPNAKGWRFIPKGYVFTDWEKPWNPPFPESITIDNLSANRSDIDFTGVRMGDVNETSNPLLNAPKIDTPKAVIKKE